MTVFTDTEILLAADRFVIRKSEDDMRICLSDAFMPEDDELVTVGECLALVRRSLHKGHKVFIEVTEHGSTNLPTAAST